MEPSHFCYIKQSIRRNFTEIMTMAVALTEHSKWLAKSLKEEASCNHQECLSMILVNSFQQLEAQHPRLHLMLDRICRENECCFAGIVKLGSLVFNTCRLHNPCNQGTNVLGINGPWPLSEKINHRPISVISYIANIFESHEVLEQPISSLYSF